MKLFLLFLAFFMSCSAHAITVVGGGPGSTATLAQGIAVGSDGVAYVFITPRHFIYTHVGAPATVGGIDTNFSASNVRLSSAASGGLPFTIGELVSDLPGLTPLPVLSWTGVPSNYFNLNLRVFGNTGFTYGHQNAGTAATFTLRDDAGGGPNQTFGMFSVFSGQPDDLYLCVDIRPQATITGTGLLFFGDSNGALVADLGGGVLAAAGSALAIHDVENPIGVSTSTPANVDINVYPFAGYYRTQIDAYLAGRSAALGINFIASYVSPAGAGSTFTISTSALPTAGGSTGGSGTFASGTSRTVTATPAANYSFVNWTEGGTAVSTSASYTFTLNANRTLVANFQPVTYSIATSSSPVAGGSTSGGGTFNGGTSQTVTATPAANYNFVNWTEGGTAVSSSSGYTFTLSSNRALVANFQPVTYTVSTNSSPVAGGSTSGGGTFNAGTSQTVTASPAANYSFVNWTEGGTAVSVSPSYTFALSGNRSLVANFQPVVYSITTSASPVAGGSTSGGGTFVSGTSQTVTATPAVNYAFVNWTEGGTAVSVSPSYTFALSSNRVLVANFQPVTYSIATSSSPVAGGSTAGSGTFTAGSSRTVTATPAANYSFVNWTEGGMAVSSLASYTFTLSANRTLVANFQAVTYNITTSASPVAGGTTSGDGTFNAGTSRTITATPAANYTFVNWTEGGTAVSSLASYTFTLSANRSLVANFQPVTYNITTSSSPGAGGTTSGSGTFNAGTSRSVTATPAANYNFVNWTEAGTIVSTSSTYSFILASNRDLVANFQLDTYNITTSASPAAGGTATGAGTFSAGTSRTVTATPAANYTFVNWTEGGMAVSTLPNYTFTLTVNRSLVANFQAVTYNIATTALPAAGGTTSGSGTFNAGTSRSVTATPAANYTFVNWTEGGTAVSTSPSYAFTLSANRTLVATFQQVTYNVATSSSPAAGGTTSGGGAFNAGTSQTVTATPSANYAFVNWTEGGTTVSTSPSFTFTLSANRSLVANFQAVTYNIATSALPAAGGTASGAGTFNGGTSRTVTATPSASYSFVSWTEGGIAVSTLPSYTFTLSANRVLTANFQPVTFTVSTVAAPVSGGSVSGGGTFNSGTSQTVMATPAANYTFVNWTESGTAVSTSPSYTFTLTANRTLTANFQPVTYTVSASPSPVAGGSTSGSGTFDAGTSRTVTATSSANYGFVNWTEGGTVVSTSPSYTFTLSSNRALVANFLESNRTITTNSAPSNGGTTTGSGSFPNGTSRTVTAAPANGFSFANWTENGVSVSGSTSYTFTLGANRTLVANFSAINYAVKTTAGPNGTVTSSAPSSNYGGTVNFTATPATGYEVAQWIVNGTVVQTGGTTLNLANVTANQDVQVTFQNVILTIAITASPPEGGATSGAGTFNSGSSQTVTAVPAANFTFVHWSENGVPVSNLPNYTFAVTASRVLTANFQPLTAAITTSSAPAAGGTTAGGGTFNTGGTQTVTASPSANHVFVNWTENGVPVSDAPVYTFTHTSNRDLVANFQQNTLTVVTNSLPASGGTTGGNGVFNADTTQTVTARAAMGYNFVQWTENGVPVSNSPGYTFTLSGNRMLTANFSLIQYYFTTTSGENGTVTSSAPSATYGGSVSFTASPNAGFEVAQWMVDGAVVQKGGSTLTLTQVAASQSVHTTFQAIQYAVSTFSLPLEGGGTFGDGSYAAGSSVTVLAVPDQGYLFESWTENGTVVSASASYQFVAQGPRNLTANFRERPTLSDLNGDGIDDLLWQHETKGDIYAWLMDENGAMKTGKYLGKAPAGWKVVGAADVDGDQLDDLLLQHETKGDVSAWLMDGTGATKGTRVVSKGAQAWRLAGATDMDGDGIDDLLWQNKTKGDVSVWLMNGTGVAKSTRLLSKGAPVWLLKGTADVDGDGIDDLLWQHKTKGDVSVWLMNGAGTAKSTRVLSKGLPVWKLVGAADVDGDSVDDLLWQHETKGDVSVWFMNGTGAVKSTRLLSKGRAEWQLDN